MNRSDRTKLNEIVKSLTERGLIEQLPNGNIRITKEGIEYAEKHCCCQYPCRCDEMDGMR